MSQLFNYDLAGKRIRLISTTDKYTRLHKNSQEIIKFSFKNAVLDKECIAVNWFDGSSTLSPVFILYIRVLFAFLFVLRMKIYLDTVFIYNTSKLLRLWIGK
jgi:hypothetical protein